MICDSAMLMVDFSVVMFCGLIVCNNCFIFDYIGLIGFMFGEYGGRYIS